MSNENVKSNSNKVLIGVILAIVIIPLIILIVVCINNSNPKTIYNKRLKEAQLKGVVSVNNGYEIDYPIIIGENRQRILDDNEYNGEYEIINNSIRLDEILKNVEIKDEKNILSNLLNDKNLLFIDTASCYLNSYSFNYENNCVNITYNSDVLVSAEKKGNVTIHCLYIVPIDKSIISVKEVKKPVNLLD